MVNSTPGVEAEAEPLGLNSVAVMGIFEAAARTDCVAYAEHDRAASRALPGIVFVLQRNAEDVFRIIHQDVCRFRDKVVCHSRPL